MRAFWVWAMALIVVACVLLVASEDRPDRAFVVLVLEALAVFTMFLWVVYP